MSTKEFEQKLAIRQAILAWQNLSRTVKRGKAVPAIFRAGLELLAAAEAIGDEDAVKALNSMLDKIAA